MQFLGTNSFSSGKHGIGNNQCTLCNNSRSNRSLSLPMQSFNKFDLDRRYRHIYHGTNIKTPFRKCSLNFGMPSLDLRLLSEGDPWEIQSHAKQSLFGWSLVGKDHTRLPILERCSTIHRKKMSVSTRLSAWRRKFTRQKTMGSNVKRTFESKKKRDASCNRQRSEMGQGVKRVFCGSQTKSNSRRVTP